MIAYFWEEESPAIAFSILAVAVASSVPFTTQSISAETAPTMWLVA